MSRLKEMMPQEAVHQRSVTMRTHPLDDERVIVEGWLRDDRLVDAFYWDGRDRPAGVVHWMCVRLLVGDWPLKILDAEAEMPGIPHELCETTKESVKKIIGLPIVAGFTERVRGLLGGVEGCAHLTYLIVAMGPAALHGYWAQRSRKRRPLPRSMEEFQGLQYLLNSCALWREEGPMVQEVRRVIEERKEGGHSPVVRSVDSP